MQTTIIILAVAIIQIISEIIKSKERKKRKEQNTDRQPKHHLLPVIMSRISTLQQKFTKFQQNCFQDFRVIKSRTWRIETNTNAIRREVRRISENSSTSDSESDTGIDETPGKNKNSRIIIVGTKKEDNRKMCNSPATRRTRWNVDAKPFTPASRIGCTGRSFRDNVRRNKVNAPEINPDDID